MDVYEAPGAREQQAVVSGGEAPGDDLAADDRIAEEFRREFMEAMSERQQRKRAKKKAPAATGPGAKDESEGLRGPKLGGSRNSRAQMRELLLQKEKEKSGR